MKCWDDERTWEQRLRAHRCAQSDRADWWAMRDWTRERYRATDCPPWEVMSRGRMYRLAFWKGNDVIAPGD